MEDRKRSAETQELIEELVSRCRLVCGQEAEALGLPQEVGYYLHDLAVNRMVYAKEQKLVLDRASLYTTRDFFQLSQRQANLLRNLYTEISNKMDIYGSLIRRVRES